MATRKRASKTSGKVGLNLNLNNSIKPSKKESSKAKKQLKKLGVRTIAVIFIFVVIGAVGGFFGIKLITKNDCFEIIGAEEITLTLAENYTDQGVKIISFGKDCSKDAIIETNLTKNADDTYSATEEGTYFITYTVNNLLYGKLFKIKKIRLVSFVEASEIDEFAEVE